jgi:hypothetical protein
MLTSNITMLNELKAAEASSMEKLRSLGIEEEAEKKMSLEIRQHLNRMAQAIEPINRSSLSTIRSMVKPPLVVQHVFEALHYLLEILFNIPQESKEFTVAPHKAVLATPSLLQRMKEVSLPQINERLDAQSRSELATFIKEAQFTVESVAKSSKPASHFWEWVIEFNACLELLSSQPLIMNIYQCGEEKRKLQLCATLSETSAVRYSTVADESIREFLSAVSIARVLDKSISKRSIKSLSKKR